MRKAIPRAAVRWVPAENIHLTLKFLGDVNPNQVEAIQAGLERACHNAYVHQLIAVGLGCFPNPRRPKVVWVGVGGGVEQLKHLRDQVEAEIAPLGFPTEERPFSAHLTLGRVKTEDSRVQAQVGEIIQATHVGEIAEWTSTIFSLMQSTLKPSGAEYNALAQIELSV